MGDGAVRALSFGPAAELYERYRPGYPEQVADLVLDGLRPPAILRALEIGAGTGKATRLFGGRGVRVTAVEPDPQMAEVLTRVTSSLPDVTVVASTLETLPGEVTATTYDVLYAAAAWHWTDPETRWVRAADLLRPGGVFASFGGPLDLADDDLRERVERVRARVMETDDVPAASVRPATGAMLWPGNDLDDSVLFGDVEQHQTTETSMWSADHFVGLLGTVSAYLVLPPDVRAGVLAEIRAALPGTVAVRRDLVVHRARRCGRPAT